MLAQTLEKLSYYPSLLPFNFKLTVSSGNNLFQEHPSEKLLVWDKSEDYFLHPSLTVMGCKAVFTLGGLALWPSTDASVNTI